MLSGLEFRQVSEHHWVFLNLLKMIWLGWIMYVVPLSSKFSYLFYFGLVHLLFYSDSSSFYTVHFIFKFFLKVDFLFF